MPTAIYSIEAITNLHAGSGDSNYEIVDKEIQRDTATGLPSIYASSLKGALREYLEHRKWQQTDIVFGCSEDRSKQKEQRAGSFSFLAADLLALPSPLADSPYYKLVYCSDTINKLYVNKYKWLQFELAPSVIKGSENNPAAFNEAAADLPVIARNHLENGISQNLWYERVVPHKTVFITGIVYEEKDKSLFEDFNKEITTSLIQIGANATIGYGLCKFTKLN
jgi:CRISPR-associated protein Cmr4